MNIGTSQESHTRTQDLLANRALHVHHAPYHAAPIQVVQRVVAFWCNGLTGYRHWQVQYFWVGCKMHDLLTGKENMETLCLMMKGKALERSRCFKAADLSGLWYTTTVRCLRANPSPNLANGGPGQHSNSRTNIALIMTTVKHGAVVANHTEVVELHRDASGG